MTTPTTISVPFNDPTLIDSNNVVWKITASTSGLIVATTGVTSDHAVPYLEIDSSPGNVTFSSVITSNGTLLMTPSPGLQAAIPYPKNITMSRWPQSIGVIYIPLGVSVAVSADMSNWCCSLQKFVKPEDTTILVVLDE